MKYLFLSFTLLTTTLLLGQTPQIDALRKARDKAEGVLHKKKAVNFGFDKLDYVDPFIGTGGHGHTYPGASAPFGMIQLSPDSRYEGWDGCSGYHYSDSIIYGFSHTHLSGTGVSDYGDLLIVPQSGHAETTPGYLDANGYGSHFSHTDEEASPGYYAVKLKDDDINVRLTVSQRAGMHEYTFNNEKGKKFILIDLDHRDKLLSSSIDIIDQSTISGSRVSHAWATEQHFYFHLELDAPYKKAQLIEKNGQHKLLLTFPKTTKTLKIRVGISAVDEAGARENLSREIPDWSFDNTLRNVQTGWRKELNKVLFYTGDNEVMTNFYTALYHSYLNPNVFSDVTRKYRGRDNAIHTLGEGEGQNYTIFSLWDTYRATHPLFTLTQVQRTNDFVRTFLRQYEQGGDLPVWELAGNETECMIGYHSVSVIADAYIKEIDNYNAFKAIQAMIATSEFDEYGKHEFNANGFIGTSREPESVSKTLEYAYDNFCIHQMMNAYTWRTEDFVFADRFDTFSNRSFNFINLYDPKTKFMRGRRSGLWFSPFDPAEVNFNYTEANSWQYSLYAPHAVGVLGNMMGGKDSLENWLDRLFTTEMSLSGRDQADITGLIGQYAHGNEPSHHMAYLYNYTNHPEKTQFYVDSILYTMYTLSPDGLSGNEDCGQMSSWYVLSALGLYQIAPGRPIYEFGRPLAQEALLQFENGRRLRIKVKNNSKENKYIQEIRWNGTAYNRTTIDHAQLVSGGTLEITMGANPNPERRKAEQGYTAQRYPKTFIPVPFFEQEQRIFDNALNISLNVVNKEQYDILYTTDGSDPKTSSSSKLYTLPFTIDASTQIRACTVDSTHFSSVVTNDFIKKNTNVSIEIKSEYANQYASNGDFTLIDGIHGGDEFRTGDWQGYWAQDMVAEITFNKPQELSEFSLGCLQDTKSWVFYPSEVIFEGSVDGINFVPIGSSKLSEFPKDYTPPEHKKFSYSTDLARVYKKIRVTARNYGKCPEWHLGNGNDTWIFVDEITFR